MADTDNEAATAPPVAAVAVAAREEAEHAKAHSAQSGTDTAPILPGIIALILAVLSAVALWFVS
jgi:hypothetical protein